MDEHRIEALLHRMSVAEKLGQMTQPERQHCSPDDVRRYHLGSVLSGGGSAPGANRIGDWVAMNDAYWAASMEARDGATGIPLIYGVDAVHGHNNLVGATIFPHNIGLGAADDPDLMERIGRATAREVLATGLEWTFAPTLAIARDIRWGRTYESYGSDPERAGRLGAALIRGLQDDLGDEAVVACPKHWVGDGGTTGGVDQGDTAVSEAELRRVHIAPYLPALAEGALTVMVSYSSWNGEKCHGHAHLIQRVLKDELGFRGFVVSDWDGTRQVAADYADALTRSVNAGVDLFMVPRHWREHLEVLTAVVSSGRVPMARVDDAVRRILRVKMAYGLFERPRPAARPLTGMPVGTPEHRAVAREAVRRSLVVLTNDGTLPLARSARVLVAGRMADSRGHACGGFTHAWQGSPGNAAFPGGTSIAEGLAAAGTEVVVREDGALEGDEDFDVAVVVIGEEPYAEGMGDIRAWDPSEAPVDTPLTGFATGATGGDGAPPRRLEPYGQTLALAVNHPGDGDLLRDLAARDIPVVAVLVSGRPLVVEAELALANAFVAAWLPGTEGSGVADVLFGDAAPVGRLPVPWPRVDDPEAPPRFPVGFGLTWDEGASP